MATTYDKIFTHMILKDDLTARFAGGVKGGDPTAVFARGSLATFEDKNNGLLRTSPATGGNIQARFETLGLLMEGSSTNELIQSEDFSDAAWVTSDTVGVVVDAAISPDGTQNAERLTNLQNATGERIRQIFDLAVSIDTKTFAGSLYLKGEGLDVGKTITVRIESNAGGVQQSSEIQVTLTLAWTRVETGTITGVVSNTGVRFLLSDTSDTADNCLAWGAQLEEQFASTSYIKTTTMATLRAAETLTIAPSNFPDPTGEFSVGININNKIDAFNSGAAKIAVRTQGNLGLVGQKGLTAAAVDRWEAAANSKFPGFTDPSGVTNRTVRVTGVYELPAGDTKIHTEGVFRFGVLSAATASTSITAFNIGTANSGGNPIYGHVSDLRIYDSALSNPEAAAEVPPSAGRASGRPRSS